VLDLNKIRNNGLVKNPEMGGAKAQMQSFVHELMNEIVLLRSLLREVTDDKCEIYELHCITHKCRLPCSHEDSRIYFKNE
jgi:hypothetical protein